MASKYKEIARKAEELGYEFKRRGKGDHEIWIHKTTGKTAVIANSGRRGTRFTHNVIASLRRGAK